MQIIRLDRSGLAAAADLLARALCDNPTHVSLHGPDRERRLRDLRVLGRSILATRPPPFGALDGGELLGVLSAVPPGGCRPSFLATLRTVPMYVRVGPRTARGLAAYGAEWSRHDPADPHWHLGPVSVAPGYQGRGIGTALMEAFIREAERGGNLPIYLETDRPENVTFYERLGFRVVEHGSLIGVSYWFMRRP